MLQHKSMKTSALAITLRHNKTVEAVCEIYSIELQHIITPLLLLNEQAELKDCETHQ